jgi:alpha-glucosidase (family GH31 glycosyl hydrolase)
MTYVNPLFSVDQSIFKKSDRHNLVEEGKALGYYVKNQQGDSYVITSGTIDFYLLDVSNPDARIWMKNIIKENMINDTGSSGWMADFGEHLPFDAVLHSGVSGADFHNQYPLESAKINEEAVAESQQKDDLVYFMRSASLSLPKHTSLYWLGDQCVSWDSYDGIKTTVIGAITGGLGGHSLTHSDIGGYTMVSDFFLNIVIITRSHFNK